MLVYLPYHPLSFSNTSKNIEAKNATTVTITAVSVTNPAIDKIIVTIMMENVLEPNAASVRQVVLSATNNIIHITNSIAGMNI
jgi:hypothetical protein